MKGLLKRIARRILRDELAFSAVLLSDVQQRLAQSRRDVTSYSNELGRLRDRTRRSLSWARDNCNPGTAGLCLAEWTHNGTEGPGFGIVNPFDRWGFPTKP